MLDKKDRILVTGAAGMVGSHVVDRLRARGLDVAGVDRRICDLRDFDKTRRLFEMVKPTQVFHPAAVVYGIGGNLKYPDRCFLENLQINTAVIDAAKHVGVRKITVMGTGCMYPDPPLSLPLKESDIFMGRPHDSEAGYAHAKLAMLAMLEAYDMHLEWACIISCNLFGPRDKFNPVTGHVIPSLIQKFYEARRDGTPVEVWGTGSARRDFIYIKDCARAVETVMDSGHGPINMGGDGIRSIRQIVDSLTHISGLPKKQVVWDDSKPNGADYRGYDLTRLTRLGFKPEWSIEHGLQETWEWYCHEQEQ